MMTTDELRRMPKVELHRHLECSLRHATLRELAPAAGIEVPNSEAEFKRQLLVTEPMRDLESVLRKFLATQQVLSSEEILTRITFEAIEDAWRDGIRILELRYAPTFIRQGHEHLSFEKIHEAILKGAAIAQHLPIAVGFISIIQRILPIETAREVMDFTIAHKQEFVGVDLADNEVGFDLDSFAPLFQRARSSGLKVTIHSGEADVPDAPTFVQQAIEKLGAQRIGHGVQIHRSAAVMNYVKDHRIPLELCPTSNWLTNAVGSTKEHPFRKLMEHGILVTINSDDPGVFDIDLTHEYRILQEEQGLTAADFQRCNDVAAAASFIPMANKQRVWPRVIAESII
jgi:adenosine deaminase